VVLLQQPWICIKKKTNLLPTLFHVHFSQHTIIYYSTIIIIMASINKLSLRGIRSFSPDDQEQVVEFYYPLTVIHGANGCTFFCINIIIYHLHDGVMYVWCCVLY